MVLPYPYAITYRVAADEIVIFGCPACRAEAASLNARDASATTETRRATRMHRRAFRSVANRSRVRPPKLRLSPKTCPPHQP